MQVISHTAIQEFKVGTAERGRSMFESCLRNYPGRLDVWSQYLDQVYSLFVLASRLVCWHFTRLCFSIFAAAIVNQLVCNAVLQVQGSILHQANGILL